MGATQPNAELREISRAFDAAPMPLDLWPIIEPYVDGLPALASSIFGLNELLSAPQVELGAVQRLVAGDPCIAAQLIRFANKDLADAGGGLSRLDECIVLLGVNQVRNLVLTMPMVPMDDLLCPQLQTFWQYSSLGASLCETLGYGCALVEPQRARIAGLLHNIGELPIMLNAHEVNCESDPELHVRIGASLARMWNLPPFLLEAIEFHHQPLIARREPLLVRIVAAVDQIVESCGVHAGMMPTSLHFTSDCGNLLRHFLPFVTDQQAAVLADMLRSQLLRWAKSPCDLQPPQPNSFVG